MNEEHAFLPNEEKHEVEEATSMYTVNKFELMCYAQITYQYFVKDVADLVTQKNMFKIQDNEGNVIPAISIRLSGFEQYGTWLLVDSTNINDMSIASVMPNDEYAQDVVEVRQLTEIQAMTIIAMSDINKFNDWFNKWSTKEVEE